MDKGALRATIGELTGADAEGCAAFAAAFSPVEVRKQAHLVREGDRCDHLYFILEGFVRVYYLKDGREITDWFGAEHSFVTCVMSYFGRKKSPQYIQALEDCRLLAIDHATFEGWCLRSHTIERFARRAVTANLLEFQQRIMALQFRTAKEKYEMLLEKHPEIVHRAPLGHIASYLGVSQETLSRVRGAAD